MLKVYINNISEGEHSFNFIISHGEIEIDTAEIVSDINVSVKLYKSGNQISLKTSLCGKFRFQCDRCTEDYISGFNNDFEIIYKYDFGEMADQSEDDDIKFIPSNTRYIDLKDDIRDYILLSVPMKRVPEDSGGECSFCHKTIKEMTLNEKQKEVSSVWEKLIKAKIK